MKKLFLALSLGMALIAGGLTSCDDSHTSKRIDTSNYPADIPSDDLADPNPTLPGGNNAVMPNVQYTYLEEDGVIVIRFDMTGIQDEATQDWLRLLGTGLKGQNIWIEIDGKPKGIVVYNTADENNEQSVAVDMTFLVDDSSSMSEEADAVARDIVAWADRLAQKGLNIQFACVGYDGEIKGAIDFCSQQDLYDWLNKGYSGIGRTYGFAENLSHIDAYEREFYRTGGNDRNECGMAALRFANDYFSFRKNANRIYVNFTDEPNQPDGNTEFTVDWLKDNWTTDMGTIHTVFSDNAEGSHYPLYDEKNKYMSEYTGGTFISCNSKFTGVTLDSLPVSDALQNSYVIRLSNVEDLFDGEVHEIKITVLSEDGTVRVERIFYITFEKN